MGWLDTVLSAASAGASLYNASQLQTLRQQGAQAALIQAMLAHLRDQIFQFKQMAEYGLAQEAQSVKRAAGVISIVASRLDDSGITPDLFPNLGDKEYAMQTIRLIGENRRRLPTHPPPAATAASRWGPTRVFARLAATSSLRRPRSQRVRQERPGPACSSGSGRCSPTPRSCAGRPTAVAMRRGW